MAAGRLRTQFLEAEAEGRAAPEFDIRLCEALRDAAQSLGLRSLQDAAESRLGEFGSRLREYSMQARQVTLRCEECSPRACLVLLCSRRRGKLRLRENGGRR